MKNKIIEILNGIRPEFDFGSETNYISQGMLDSFDLITLVTELDESFGISIDGTDILPENFESAEAIEALLKKNGAQ
ncbi:phosphopantetheine-binding protein [Chryseobacterium foetidum]|uniref:phosphopantetheine-binding protein n=1 Tax=Chryseobacterium foetidum TaxID=2951057 RepID=UPI0021CA2F3C|nr:phosphopantetheine-binding protein [Chryseobacterium foetidum]